MANVVSAMPLQNIVGNLFIQLIYDKNISFAYI